MFFSLEKINLQSLNQARSAFIIFRFNRAFFSSFQKLPNASLLKVQVPVKACCAVFRAVSSVESCDVILGETENALDFVLHCKMGVEKKYRLPVEETAAHKAIYNKITPHRIVSRPRTLQDCINNFHSGIEEITLVPLSHQLKLKSFVDDAAPVGRGLKVETNSVLLTELVVESADFDLYSVRPGAQELTFSLKELRAILGFCEAAGQPVSIFFSDPGSPILWSVNCFDALVVDFVLATLAAVGDGSQLPGSSSAASSQPQQQQTLNGAASFTPMSRSSSQPPLPATARSEYSDQEGDGDGEYVEGTPERERKKAKSGE